MESVLETLRKTAGTWYFAHIHTPPEDLSETQLTSRFDYGHHYFYNELFSGDGTDVDYAIDHCRSHSGKVLDIGGGCGRLALALAKQGIPVTLVDNSTSMLQQVLSEKRDLHPAEQELFECAHQDMRSLRLDSEFQTVFLVNNPLEHLSNEKEILEVLNRVRVHLREDGDVFVDVHNSLHEGAILAENRNWKYERDTFVGHSRLRVWSRLKMGISPNQIIAEHAVSIGGNSYQLLSTPLLLLAKEEWAELFHTAGFKILTAWGNWQAEPIQSKLPKMIFRIRRR